MTDSQDKKYRHRKAGETPSRRIFGRQPVGRHVRSVPTPEDAGKSSSSSTVDKATELHQPRPIPRDSSASLSYNAQRRTFPVAPKKEASSTHDTPTTESVTPVSAVTEHADDSTLGDSLTADNSAAPATESTPDAGTARPVTGRRAARRRARAQQNLDTPQQSLDASQPSFSSAEHPLNAPEHETEAAKSQNLYQDDTVMMAPIKDEVNPSPTGVATPQPEKPVQAAESAQPEPEPQLPDIENVSTAKARAEKPGHWWKAALQTLFSGLIPGLGLISTKKRVFGIALLSAVVLSLIVLLVTLLFNHSVLTLVAIGANRWILIALLALVLIGGIVWLVQVIFTNREHNQMQRLSGKPKAASIASMCAIILAFFLPWQMVLQYLWAGQQFLGSETFGHGNSKQSLTPGEDPWRNLPRINVMVLGQDAGADRAGTRPDTIMVASIDTQTGRTALFSIPRNLMNVKFPEGTAASKRFPDGFNYFKPNTENLINAVWSWAEDEKELFPGDNDPGLTATTWAVEETLGLKIDYYAMVNLQGFQEAIDAMGGISIDVERWIPIGGGRDPGASHSHPITGWIAPGEQHLDGYHALWYARSREYADDWDRICRQQRVVRTVTAEAQPFKLATSLPGLLRATERNIETDIPTDQIPAFAELAVRVKNGGFMSFPMDRRVHNPNYPPNTEALHKWVQASIAATEVKPETTPTPSATPTTSAPSTSSSASPSASPSATPSPSESKAAADPSSDKARKATDAGELTYSEEEALQSCMPGHSRFSDVRPPKSYLEEQKLDENGKPL